MEAAITSAGRREYLTFGLGDEEYAIDILQVREIRAQESVTRIANTPHFVRGVINLRGEVVPIADMRGLFGMQALGQHAAPVMIILDVGTRVIGIVVDAVCDVVGLLPGQVRPAPALASAADAACVSGLAPVDGRMLIVVDMARLLASRSLGAEAQAA